MSESIDTQEAAAKQKTLKLNVPRIIMVGLAFFTITMFWEIYDNLMPLFLKDFNFGQTLTGVIMALDNILALLLLPFMGLWSDKFPTKLRSKIGRRIPFIICGSVLAAVCFILVNFAHNERNLALMLVSTVFVLLFMCLYRTPAVALMPDVTPKPLRSQANTIINIMGAVGTMITLGITLIPGVLIKETIGEGADKVTNLIGNNWIIVAIISSLMVLSAIIMVFKVKENKLLEDKKQQLEAVGMDEDEEEKPSSKMSTRKVIAGLDKNQIKSLLFILVSVFLWYMAYNGVKTHFSRFAMEELNMPNFTLPLLIGNIAAFAMFYPASKIGQKIGRKKTVMIGVVLLIAGFALASLLLFVASPAVTAFAMYPVFLLVGGGWATINVHSYVMSVEMATKDTTGVFTGLYYTFAMSAQIVTPILAGLIIEFINYKLLMVYALVFSVLALITMSFVKHGNAKEVPTNEDPQDKEEIIGR